MAKRSMESTKESAQGSEVDELLRAIDEDYESVIMALTELKSSRKLDLFIRKRLDAIVARHVQIAARIGTQKASILVCQHLGETVKHSIIVTNMWLSILLVDYRFRYERLMQLSNAMKPGSAHCEIVEVMHELLYITSILQNSIGVKRTAQRIQAILAVAIEREQKA